VAYPIAATVAAHVMSIILFALRLQPEEGALLPSNPFSDGDHVVLIAFIVVIGLVFGFEMFRTWWSTTEWRREAKRRRRELL